MLCLLDLSILEPFGSANLTVLLALLDFLRFRVRYEVFKVRFAEGFRVMRLLFRRRFAWRTFKTIHEGKSRRLVVLWRTPVCVLPTRAALFAALRSSRFLSALSRPVVSSGPIDLRILARDSLPRASP